MSDWSVYRRTEHTGDAERIRARPYVPGEDMSGIAVAPAFPPEEGGYIAYDLALPDQHPYYITPTDFLRAGYE